LTTYRIESLQRVKKEKMRNREKIKENTLIKRENKENTVDCNLHNISKLTNICLTISTQYKRVLITN